MLAQCSSPRHASTIYLSLISYLLSSAWMLPFNPPVDKFGMDPAIDALVAGLRASRERFRLTTEQDLRQLQVELAGFGSPTAKIVPTTCIDTPTRPRRAGGLDTSPRTVEPLRERLRELKAHMAAEEAGGAQLMSTLRDEPREALACRAVVAERQSDELRAELEVVSHALTRETQRCTTAEQRLRQETAKRAEAAATIGPAPLVERAAPAALAPLAGRRLAVPLGVSRPYRLCIWGPTAPTGARAPPSQLPVASDTPPVAS